jgi:hypothetical protein
MRRHVALLSTAGVLLVVAVVGVVVLVLVDRPSSDGQRSASVSTMGSASASPPVTPSATATARPSPSRTSAPSANRAGCAPKPSACDYPDATNTGVPAGTALTVVNGDLTVSTAGAVVDAKDIRGCVLIKAPNVTIRRSKVTCTGDYGIGSFTEQYSGGGLLIEDSEISCAGSSATAIGYYGLTARRLDITNCENGFDVDSNISVYDSYIHDLRNTDVGHTDGIQLAVGLHIVIQHNTIYNPGGTSAIISHPTANSDVLIANNLLAGGAYTLYCPRDSSVNFRVVDNRFGRQYSAKGGAYGPWDSCQKVAEQHGNVWDDTLAPVTPE